MKNILITRSKISSKKLKEALEILGYRVFVEPLFSIKKTLVELDFLKQNAPEISNILISSANAIYVLNELNIPKETTIYAVGSSTADKIKKLGYNNIFYPKKSSGLELYKIIIQNIAPQQIYYFHGEKISFDFKKKLQKKGFEIKDFEIHSFHIYFLFLDTAYQNISCSLLFLSVFLIQSLISLEVGCCYFTEFKFEDHF